MLTLSKRPAMPRSRRRKPSSRCAHHPRDRSGTPDLRFGCCWLASSCSRQVSPHSSTLKRFVQRLRKILADGAAPSLAVAVARNGEIGVKRQAFGFADREAPMAARRRARHCLVAQAIHGVIIATRSPPTARVARPGQRTEAPPDRDSGFTCQLRRMADSSSAPIAFLNRAPGWPLTRRSHSAHVAWRIGVPSTRLRYE